MKIITFITPLRVLTFLMPLLTKKKKDRLIAYLITKFKLLLSDENDTDVPPIRLIKDSVI